MRGTTLRPAQSTDKQQQLQLLQKLPAEADRRLPYLSSTADLRRSSNNYSSLLRRQAAFGAPEL